MGCMCPTPWAAQRWRLTLRVMARGVSTGGRRGKGLKEAEGTGRGCGSRWWEWFPEEGWPLRRPHVCPESWGRRRDSVDSGVSAQDTESKGRRPGVKNLEGPGGEAAHVGGGLAKLRLRKQEGRGPGQGRSCLRRSRVGGELGRENGHRTPPPGALSPLPGGPLPADRPLCPLRSQVSTPAGQDLGAARAPGVRTGPGVTPSRSAEVRDEAACRSHSVWSGRAPGFFWGDHVCLVLLPKTSASTCEGS